MPPPPHRTGTAADAEAAPPLLPPQKQHTVDYTAKAMQLFEALDSTQNGTVEKQEWLSYLLPTGIGYDVISGWWEQADTNQNGHIDEKEFRTLAELCPEELARAFDLASPAPLLRDERLSLLAFRWEGSTVRKADGGVLDDDVEGYLLVPCGAGYLSIGRVDKHDPQKSQRDAELAALASSKKSYLEKYKEDGEAKFRAREAEVQQRLLEASFKERVALLDNAGRDQRLVESATLRTRSSKGKSSKREEVEEFLLDSPREEERRKQVWMEYYVRVGEHAKARGLGWSGETAQKPTGKDALPCSLVAQDSTLLRSAIDPILDAPLCAALSPPESPWLLSSASTPLNSQKNPFAHSLQAGWLCPIQPPGI